MIPKRTGILSIQTNCIETVKNDARNMKRLFVVSDIHGHYTLMKKALDDAGFDEYNDNHVFVSCGDLFDRGVENRKVYDFVRRLKKKVLICGNHDERLLAIMSEKRVQVSDLYNGTDITVEEFFGTDSIGPYGQISFPTYGKMTGNLRRFISSMLDFYETKHYVFVHGWIPIETEGKTPLILENWRKADAEAWHNARFLEWQQLYGTSAMLAEKTIVCGHRPARLGHMFDPFREPDNSNIFYGDGMIAIDAGTVRSGRVNVLVLDEEMNLPQ